jgi:tRNA (cytidine/uridine-2'-O-)-methyltransferase
MQIISCGQFALSRDKGGNLRLQDKGGEARMMQARPALHVALYHPEIPQNTGNVARTCAATHTPLHLVEPLGFRLSDRYLKRAGLDYWPHVSLKIHPSFEVLRKDLFPSRMVYFSAHASRLYYQFHFLPGDCLVFGSETSGLPEEILDFESDRIVQIPIDRSRVRSLNLATSVGAALFEAIRQLAFYRQEPVFSRWSGFENRSKPGGSVMSLNSS